MPTLSSSSSSSGSSGSSSSGSSSSSEDEERQKSKGKRVKNGGSASRKKSKGKAAPPPTEVVAQPPEAEAAAQPSSGGQMTKEERRVLRTKCSLLRERISAIRQDNDLLVSKISGIGRLCKLRLAHRKHLMDRLDAHGDNFRDVPVLVPNETSKDKQEIKDHHQQLPSQQRIKRPYKKRRTATESETGSDAVATPNPSKSTGSSSTSAKRSRKEAAASTAAEMPKKPHNAYFYFCQDFRSSVVSSLHRVDHESPPDKREVASVLTAKWNALNFDQKQVYYRIQDEKKREYESALRRWEELNPEASECR